MAEQDKTGVLLINMGTPDAPTADAVHKYLAEFLMDPWVIDIPKVLRYILVHAMILPERHIQSAKAYRQIWTQRGSPLFEHSMNLAELVQHHLGPAFVVLCGM